MLHLDNQILPIIMTDVKVGLFSGLNLAVMSINGAKEQQENPEHISTQHTRTDISHVIKTGIEL